MKFYLTLTTRIKRYWAFLLREVNWLELEERFCSTAIDCSHAIVDKLVTDGVPVISLATDPPGEDVTKRKSRKLGEDILSNYPPASINLLSGAPLPVLTQISKQQETVIRHQK